MLKHTHLTYHEIIEDICYIYIHIPDEGILTRKKRNVFWLFVCIAASKVKQLLFNIFYINRHLLKGWRQSAAQDLQDKLWLVVNSLNTRSSLSFIHDVEEQATFVSTHSAPFGGSLSDLPRISVHGGLWQAYKFFGAYRYISQKHGHAKAARMLDIIFEAVVAYEGSKIALRQSRPQALIFANDHTFKNRALLHAALQYGIATVYIQHAAVSEYFPPLLYDLSLLEGQDTLEKYKSNNKKVGGTVKLIGMPKYDEWLPHRKSNSAMNTIGICGNLLDDNTAVEELIKALAAGYPQKQIIYRPHPRDTRDIHLPKGTKKSAAREEGIFEFLRRIDLLIASNSSTHLEATLMNVPSIYYEFGAPPVSDYYGFIAQGMIMKAHNLESMKKAIDANFFSDQLYRKAKYYNDVLDTEWEGRSAALALKYIKSL